MGSLTAKHKKAAVLVAEDNLTEKAIAQQVGVHFSAIHKWKKRPEFAALVEENVELLNTQALQHGIARREHRVGVLQELHRRMLKIVEERAADPTMKDVRGGSTGLMVGIQKTLGWGEKAEIVTEYVLDNKLLTQLVAVHERVARELGQEVNRSEVNGSLNITVETIDEILNRQKETQ